jgi:hypothetical protein
VWRVINGTDPVLGVHEADPNCDVAAEHREPRCPHHDAERTRLEPPPRAEPVETEPLVP